MTALRALALITSPFSMRTSAGIPVMLKRDAMALWALRAAKGTASQGIVL